MDKERTRRVKRKQQAKCRKRNLISVAPIVRRQIDELVALRDYGAAPELIRRLVEEELARCKT